MVLGSQDAQHQRNDAEPNNEAAGVTGSGWTVAPRAEQGHPRRRRGAERAAPPAVPLESSARAPFARRTQLHALVKAKGKLTCTFLLTEN